MASPRAASPARPARRRPVLASAEIGPCHWGQRISVKASERPIFAASGALRNTASGRNAKTHETRASVNRNPNSVAYVKSESARITAQVSQDIDRVSHALVHHPRHQKQAAAEECN